MFSRFKKASVDREGPISIFDIRENNADGPYRFYAGNTILSSLEFSRMVKDIESVFQFASGRWFDAYVRPFLVDFAEFVQAAPASALHHHQCAYGLVEHTFEVLLGVLQQAQRSKYFMPDRFAEKHSTADYQKAAQLCAVIVVLAHDMGKIKSDMTINLYDNEGKLSDKHNYDCDRNGFCNYSVFDWYLDSSKQLKNVNLRFKWFHEPNREGQHVQYRQDFIDRMRKKFHHLLKETTVLAPFLLQLDSPDFSVELKKSIKSHDGESAIRGIHPDSSEIARSFEASFRLAIRYLGQRGHLNPLPLIRGTYLFLSHTELARLIKHLPNDDVYKPLLFDPERPDKDNNAKYILSRMQGHGLAILTDDSFDGVTVDGATTLRWFNKKLLGSVLNEDISNAYVVHVLLGPDADLPQPEPPSSKADNKTRPSNEDQDKAKSPADGAETVTSIPSPPESGTVITELLDDLIKVQMKKNKDFITRVGQSLDFSINWLKQFEARTGIEISEIATEAPGGVDDHFRFIRSESGSVAGITVLRPFADRILKNNGMNANQYFSEEQVVD